MSFLNPVNVTVLRFSSTDADAPQIDYATRTAGDVKAVIKACLVDGYGTTASAGWSVVNEVGHVAEFVSPSVAMSDYRLGIDDSSGSITNWYFDDAGTVVEPTYAKITKDMGRYKDNISPLNGWQLLVTQKGFFFIEKMEFPNTGAVRGRMTYYGQLKSALIPTPDSASNIALWCVGLAAPMEDPTTFFRETAKYGYFRVGNYSALSMRAPNISMMNVNGEGRDSDVSAITFYSKVMLAKNSNLIAEQPGFMLADTDNSNQPIIVADTTVNGRPCLYVFLARDLKSANSIIPYGTASVIFLDQWEF